MNKNVPTALAATLLAFLRANITITNIIAPDKITYTRQISPAGDTVNGIAILTGRIMNRTVTGENSRVSLNHTKMRNIREAMSILTTSETQERLLIVTQSDQNPEQPIRLVAFRYDDLDWLVEKNRAVTRKTKRIDNTFYTPHTMDDRLIGSSETDSIIDDGISFDFSKFQLLAGNAVLSATIDHATLTGPISDWVE